MKIVKEVSERKEKRVICVEEEKLMEEKMRMKIEIDIDRKEEKREK